jgi:hypothetical protein
VAFGFGGSEAVFAGAVFFEQAAKIKTIKKIDAAKIFFIPVYFGFKKMCDQYR